MGIRNPIIFDTPLCELTKQFNIRARVKGVWIPADLYNDFLTLYRQSQCLHDSLRNVIEDGEHILLMEEGRGDFRLPREGFLQGDLAIMRGYLKGFDPYRLEKKSANVVWLSSEQVQGYFNVFAKSHDIVSEALDALRTTDYLKYHRYLRDVQQVKYAGPTSLQEIVDVYCGIYRTQKKQQNYLEVLQALPPARVKNNAPTHG